MQIRQSSSEKCSTDGDDTNDEKDDDEDESCVHAVGSSRSNTTVRRPRNRKSHTPRQKSATGRADAMASKACWCANEGDDDEEEKEDDEPIKMSDESGDWADAFAAEVDVDDCGGGEKAAEAAALRPAAGDFCSDCSSTSLEPAPAPSLPSLSLVSPSALAITRFFLAPLLPASSATPAPASAPDEDDAAEAASEAGSVAAVGGDER